MLIIYLFAPHLFEQSPAPRQTKVAAQPKIKKKKAKQRRSEPREKSKERGEVRRMRKKERIGVMRDMKVCP